MHSCRVPNNDISPRFSHLKRGSPMAVQKVQKEVQVHGAAVRAIDGQKDESL